MSEFKEEHSGDNMIEKINQQLKKVNNLLNSLAQKDILNNPDYKTDDFSNERYFKIHFNKKNHISFSLLFSEKGIDISIDRIIEAISLKYKEVCEGNSIEEFLKLLYLYKITVEYIGDNHTIIKFFDRNNSLVKKIKNKPERTFFSKLFTKEKEVYEYLPIIDDMVIINTITTNTLIINIPEQTTMKPVEAILKYLHYDTPLYCYLFFGYREYNKDITEYIDYYPELANDKGFIKIKEEDIQNVSFIVDILNEYQMASLFINKIPGLEKKYGFVTIRDSTSLFEGYVIKEFKYGYMEILKENTLPQWENLINELANNK
jgi:hypothetical protein